MAKKRQVKTGVRKGGGPRPGYKWSVLILDQAYKEASSAFTAAQYQHLAMQVKELARHENPSHSDVLSIDKIEDFYELREKGGLLGNINVRLFFGIDKAQRAIVVLGALKKQNDGPTPTGDKVRMRYRWREYRRGNPKA